MPETTDARTHPGFPHGFEAGYKKGCRASYPCPATPTCATAHAAECNERRHRKRAEHRDTRPEPGEARTGFYVRRRLADTLTRTTITELAARTGLSVETIEQVGESAATYVHEAVAAPLDKAWTWYRYGRDLDTLTTEDHGRYNTYLWGCRCDRCVHARNLSRKRQQVGIKTPGTVEPITPALAAHTRALVDAAGSRSALRRLIGLEPGTTAKIIEGRGGVYRSTLARLLAVTPEQVARDVDDRALVPRERTHRQLGMLRAQGYPTVWVLRQAGLDTEYNLRQAATKVTNRVARAVDAMFARYADQPATPASTGLSQTHITKAKNQARADGFYPAICYDEDGNLDVRALPDHPWSEADHRAAATLDALYLRVGCETSLAAIAKKVGAPREKNVERLFATVGLRASVNTTSGHRLLDLRPESVPVAARITEVYHRYESGELGPVTALLMLGLTRTLTLGDNSGAIPGDHPEWVAFHATSEQVAA